MIMLVSEAIVIHALDICLTPGPGFLDFIDILS